MTRIAVGSCLCLLLAGISPNAGAAGPSETLLPASTQGFIAVTDVEELKSHWQGTQLGQLMQDPVMEPFAQDLRRQFEERWSGVEAKLGVTLEDIQDVLGGELAAALVPLDEGRQATLLLMDVTGRVDRAEALIQKAAANQIRRGAVQTQRQLRGTQVTVFQLPEEADGKGPAEVACFLESNLLAATDEADGLDVVLARLHGAGHDLLADEPAFRAVQGRCQADMGERVPQIRWYVEPWGYLEAIREAGERQGELAPSERETPLVEIFRRTGFSAIRAIGGCVDVGVDGFEYIHRTAVYAPGPYESSMKMMVFPNGDSFTPPAWVPRDVASYACVQCDILNAFDHFGPLFDGLYGEGETGIWEDVLDSLEQDPNGPQINLRSEMIAHLGQRVTVISNYRLPITTTSERLLFAIEVKNEAAVAAAIQKTLQDDDQVRRREFNGHVIWENIPESERPARSVRLDLPPVGPGGKEQKDETEPLFPNTSFTVAYGHLMIASHYDFLVQILTPIQPREALGRSIDWMIVDRTLTRLGADQDCARTFSRTADEYRAAYEMIRQGKLPQSQSVLGRLLNRLFGTPETGQYREPKVDGSQMPEYEYVRRHLGPAGLYGVSEENGWFFKGFALPNQGL